MKTRFFDSPAGGGSSHCIYVFPGGKDPGHAIWEDGGERPFQFLWSLHSMKPENWPGHPFPPREITRTEARKIFPQHKALFPL